MPECDSVIFFNISWFWWFWYNKSWRFLNRLVSKNHYMLLFCLFSQSTEKPGAVEFWRIDPNRHDKSTWLLQICDHIKKSEFWKKMLSHIMFQINQIIYSYVGFFCQPCPTLLHLCTRIVSGTICSKYIHSFMKKLLTFLHAVCYINGAF